MNIEILSNYVAPWAQDAFIDSVKTLPFLFVVFLFIEIFEHFWANKIKEFLKASKKSGPLLGAAAASIPQCGFSVVASLLYCEKFITRGAVIAVYLATSDEAIPVILMYPKFLPYIIPLILIKLLVAIPIGYLVDYLFKQKEAAQSFIAPYEADEGCHKHNITHHRKRDFLIHPIEHTASVFAFILILTLILNYLMEIFDISLIFKTNLSFLAPLAAAVFGLIPNCAVSVGLVLLFIKGAISFGTMTAGLTTGAGIGLLILLKNNKDKKDTALILAILIVTGYITGLLINLTEKFI